VPLVDVLPGSWAGTAAAAAAAVGGSGGGDVADPHMLAAEATAKHVKRPSRAACGTAAAWADSVRAVAKELTAATAAKGTATP